MVRWVVLVAASLAVTIGLAFVELGAAPLLGALVAGMVLALCGRAPHGVPGWSSSVAQAVIGVSIGTNVSPESLRSAASHWLPLLVVCVLTLGVSMLGGLALSASRKVDRVTGVLSLTAGGASGLTAMSRELGADDRVVSVLQYMRVLLISFSNPLIAALLVGDVVSDGPVVAAVAPQPPADWGTLAAVYGAFAACCVVGPWLASRLHVPAGGLLVPMVLVGIMGGSGVPVGIGVPDLVTAAAFFVIGWQAGLRFTMASLRSVVKLLPAALALTVALIAACGAIGFGLSRITGLSLVEGYLATTPGGLYVVLAVAVAIDGIDLAFVVAVQVARVFLMLLISPLLARLFAPGPEEGESAVPA